MVQFINEFYKWALPEQLVTHLVLNVGDQMEEVMHVNLVVPKNIPQSISKRRFKF